MSEIKDYLGHDDNMDFLKELENETPQEISEREREYYEECEFKRKLTDKEWEEFWKVEKVKLGYKD